MKIVLLHAYSSSNSGDGLLVEEAIRLISQVLLEPQIIVLALDPDSFSDFSGVTFLHPLSGETATPSKKRLIVSALRSLLRGSTLPSSVAEVVDSADLIVGVGGGYLRSSTLIEGIKMMLVHFPQLSAASHNNASVYLPQSVGPLRFGTDKAIMHRLRKVQTIFLRDNRSFELLSSFPGSHRAPDTALLPLASGSRQITHHNDSLDQGVGLVARRLLGNQRRRRRYEDQIREFARQASPRLLLQAKSRGNNDNEFYERILGVASEESVSQATTNATRSVEVVVSVRLHGAIQSIRNGVPAIHLSYERKGWGAFEDLGLDEFVHNAFDFDTDTLLRQVDELRCDPSRYWSIVWKAQGSLAVSESKILGSLKGR